MAVQMATPGASGVRSVAFTTSGAATTVWGLGSAGFAWGIRSLFEHHLFEAASHDVLAPAHDAVTE